MKLILKKPLKEFRINQLFGANAITHYKKIGMKGHNGIDFYAPDGTPVYASHDGRVVFAGYDSAGGLGVVIRTEKKFDFEGKQTYYKTIYWHLKKGTLKVTGGQNIKTGDIVGLADNTGLSTGSHLHYGLKPILRGEKKWIWYNSESNNGYKGAIDPMPYLDMPFYLKFGNVEYGYKNDGVSILQTLLMAREYKIKIDGVFGKNTRKFVKDFQKKSRLKSDGVVDSKTWEKLLKFN